MDQGPKKVIRGAEVEGIAFLDPKSKATSEASEIKAQSQARMNEILRQKGVTKEQADDIIEIWTEAEKEGFRRGLAEGQKQGYDIGKEEGLEAGFREGTAKSREELKQLIQMMNAVAMGLALKQEGIFEQLKPEIIQFILAVCEQILRKQLSNSKALIDLIERLLAEAKPIAKDAIFNILLHSDDLAMIEKDLKKIVYDKDEIKKLNFIADKSIEKGNCRVETSIGLINFDIKRILADLEKKVLEVTIHDEKNQL